MDTDDSTEIILQRFYGIEHHVWETAIWCNVSDKESEKTKEGADNPLADERLKTMIQIRKRNPAIRDNYRYWLLQYRAIYESFSTARGEYPIDTLYNEIKLARNEVSRLEPEYGKFINENLSRWDKPELAPWGWPRSFNYAWRHENSFVK